MTKRLFLNYKCGCGTEYFPFSEEQRKCPGCGEIASDEYPDIGDIVAVARDRMEHGLTTNTTLFDRYVSGAMFVIGQVEASKQPPKDREGIDALCAKLLEGTDFSGRETIKEHFTAFVKAVLTEAYIS